MPRPLSTLEISLEPRSATRISSSQNRAVIVPHENALQTGETEAVSVWAPRPGLNTAPGMEVE